MKCKQKPKKNCCGLMSERGRKGREKGTSISKLITHVNVSKLLRGNSKFFVKGKGSLKVYGVILIVGELHSNENLVLVTR